MAKVKNKVIHIKKQITKTSCEWETFYEDDEVPRKWRKLFLDQGGEFKGKKEPAEEKPAEVPAPPREEEPEEEVPAEEETPVEEAAEEAPAEEKKVWTEEELFAENKDKQVELLNELGAQEVPKYEKDRVELILDLQNK